MVGGGVWGVGRADLMVAGVIGSMDSGAVGVVGGGVGMAATVGVSAAIEAAMAVRLALRSLSWQEYRSSSQL